MRQGRLVGWVLPNLWALPKNAAPRFLFHRPKNAIFMQQVLRGRGYGALGLFSTWHPMIAAKPDASLVQPSKPLLLFARQVRGAATPSKPWQPQHTPSSSAHTPKAGSNGQNRRAPLILTSWRNNRTSFSRQSLLVPAARPTSRSSAHPTIKVKAVKHGEHIPGQRERVSHSLGMQQTQHHSLDIKKKRFKKKKRERIADDNYALSSLQWRAVCSSAGSDTPTHHSQGKLNVLVTKKKKKKSSI